MIIYPKEFLTHFGWDGFFENQVPPLSKENIFVARVINEEKNLYRLQYDFTKVIWGSVTGKMQFEARGRGDFPAVGDWVVAERNGERAVIKTILQRKNTLQRKKVGEVSEIQILASNVDYVFITTSVNYDLNAGRLERYLTFAWDSGATPVILLTKADLEPDIDAVLAEVEERFTGVNIFSISQDSFSEAKFLGEYFKKGKTSVLVGSSGVGKSTLANFLIGEELITTQEIRGDDHKGKHTTTSRSLYVSRFGGLVIDTPGMRELQFSDHEDGLAEQFGDIEELMTRCQFTNCQHQAEKGCAVLAALENGELMLERWKSFKKIEREVRFEMRKQHKWMMAQEKKAWKKRSQEIRQRIKGW